MTIRFGGRRFTYHALFEPRLALVLTSATDRQAWRLAHAEAIGIEFLVLWDDLPEVKGRPDQRRLLAEAVDPFPVPGVVWFDATLKADGDMIEIRSVGHEPLR